MERLEDAPFPVGADDEVELFLQWLRYLRGAVVRKVAGLGEDEARWTPEGRLIPLIGIVHHLTRVEWRWIDGSMGGQDVSRTESEFRPGPELTVEQALAAYQDRAAATEAAVRSMPLSQRSEGDPDKDLRWVLIHLVNETARHAGHADAVRELLDGTTGE
ncbi:MAG: hypothetical protein AVDCRST_MAG47-1307 [uncultured Nocardioidaceae bacterium]|uniref:Mini-circle protein n=1 Tax=uncultured Nocardioidaceae bacterium TaxID=253824 RepID=A0A6J4MXH8_9ACTN|nr:MAG: hypothetical protein AVDCRST_MAG47-1307 [uncultured Nocardioidaceae bacterium]